MTSGNDAPSPVLVASRDTCGTRLRRVSLLIGQLGLGGTEKQVVLLAAGLRARGVDVRVLVMFEGGPREERLRALGVPVEPLGFRRRSAGWRMPAANVAAFVRLVGHLHRTRPQALHAFLFHSYVTAAPAARLARVPVLVAGRRSLANFRRGHPLLWAADALATSLTDHLVANARVVAEDTLRDRFVRRDKISVVRNGLPGPAFDPAPAAVITTMSPVILCVANLLPYKGHRYLLDAVALLRTRGSACTLVLAGDGPERAALEDQAARLGIDVRFLGTRTDIRGLLARADVVVLASLEEGMSNAVMEAMAAGRPVVATDVGGTRELLDGRGVLVPPASPDALADGIERLLSDPAFAADLATKARAWSRAHLSADAMVERHVRLYRDLLDRARRPGRR
ncbi:glycosyltransferase [Actinoallomurus rhizosphaericola]|uniref:glycosyltransferase n=1 Tax=Actinoallomurus rhizosphaericola TaxID=2952536 RepID=UPI002093FF89|nr:glycosyltransferase [Actinoallomurus rhizosphaericola]MCO5998399.1 glycosyltransferase [Actinoallomurus rhizosphaericola]